MVDTGDDSGADLEIDWNDPEIAEYYYNLYCTNPEMYQMMLMTNPNDPSLVAAQEYAESQNLRLIQEEIDYRAEKKEIAEKWDARWDAVAQLGPDPAYMSRVKEAWDTSNDFSNGIIAAAGSRTNDWVVQNGGAEVVADSAEVLEEVGLSVQKDTSMVGPISST